MQENESARVWDLPPVILHPFAGRQETDRLIEGSKLNLAMTGVSTDGEEDTAFEKLLACRYHEVRMLYFVGKDLFRWISQCVDFVARTPELQQGGITGQSFADYLVHRTPGAIDAKLRGWGVSDYSALFARAIGLHAVFREPPVPGALSPEFLRGYHRYADAMFLCYQAEHEFARIGEPKFAFEFYASGEYSRMLEERWTEG